MSDKIDKLIAEGIRIERAPEDPFPWGNLLWLLIFIGIAAVCIAGMGG